MATVTCTPAAPTAALDACEILVEDADANDAAAYDANLYPSMPEIRYYIEATASGVDPLRSHVFAPNGGKHQWHNVIFPEAGSWTVTLHDASDDSSVATDSVTVS